MEQGLLLLNQGSVQTCVRQRGGSIVDISFASPAVARRVRGWRVMEEVETLSDHRYIRFDVSSSSSEDQIRAVPGGGGPRWAVKQLNKEALLEASIVQAWVSSPTRPVSIDEEAEWLQEALSQVCDATYPTNFCKTPGVLVVATYRGLTCRMRGGKASICQAP